MFKIEKASSGAPWFCLFYNDILLETFDRKWQAVEAQARYERLRG